MNVLIIQEKSANCIKSNMATKHKEIFKLNLFLEKPCLRAAFYKSTLHNSSKVYSGHQTIHCYELYTTLHSKNQQLKKLCDICDIIYNLSLGNEKNGINFLASIKLFCDTVVIKCC